MPKRDCWVDGKRVFDFIRICQTVFHLLRHAVFSPAMMRDPFSHMLTVTGYYKGWLVCHWNSYLIMVLVCIFLMTHDGEDPFMCLFPSISLLW